MTDTPLTPKDADDALAAEYVLGVQDLTERSATEARIKSDPGFSALVVAWEHRLAGLNDDFAEVPAPDLLPRIEARLFPEAPRPPRTGAGFGLVRWLSGAAAGVLVLIVAVATVLPPQQALVAVLATADNRLAYEVRSQGDTLRVTRVSGLPAGEGRVHELWVIAPGAAPVSLGLLEGETLVVNYPTPLPGWSMAVSIEPEGGSPTGAPTGPVILVAQVLGQA
ncbi:MAG: anti-sigma factor [Tabrizicola sp.]|jgi:anti-sigma-K factor RskA|nr:anti-sigma factor [Tabrizicola sp.]